MVFEEKAGAGEIQFFPIDGIPVYQATIWLRFHTGGRGADSSLRGKRLRQSSRQYPCRKKGLGNTWSSRRRRAPGKSSSFRSTAFPSTRQPSGCDSIPEIAERILPSEANGSANRAGNTPAGRKGWGIRGLRGEGGRRGNPVLSDRRHSRLPGNHLVAIPYRRSRSGFFPQRQTAPPIEPAIPLQEERAGEYVVFEEKAGAGEIQFFPIDGIPVYQATIWLRFHTGDRGADSALRGKRLRQSSRQYPCRKKGLGNTWSSRRRRAPGKSSSFRSTAFPSTRQPSGCDSIPEIAERILPSEANGSANRAGNTPAGRKGWGIRGLRGEGGRRGNPVLSDRRHSRLPGNHLVAIPYRRSRSGFCPQRQTAPPIELAIPPVKCLRSQSAAPVGARYFFAGGFLSGAAESSLSSSTRVTAWAKD